MNVQYYNTQYNSPSGKALPQGPNFFLMTNGPCKTIGSAADINVPGDFQCFYIYDHYVIIRRASHKGPRTVRLHKYSCRAMADFQSLHFLTRPRIVNGQISRLKARDERKFTICCKD